MITISRETFIDVMLGEYPPQHAPMIALKNYANEYDKLADKWNELTKEAEGTK